MVIIEITQNWLKCLCGTSAALKDIRVNRVAACPIQSNTREELLSAINTVIDRKTLAQYGPLTLCVPRSQVTLRNLRFPSTDEREIGNIVSLHLTQQVPYSRDEIIHNYMILDKTAAGFTNVLLGIVHRDVLRKQYAALEELNMLPDNILLGTWGLMRFLKKAKVTSEESGELRACLDIDSQFTDLVVFQGGKILFSKSLFSGVLQINERDRMKRFIGEIKQALVVFQTDQAREKIARLYITGAMPRDINGVADRMAQDLEVATEVLDPGRVFPSLGEVKDVGPITSEVSLSALAGCATEPLSKTMNFVLPEAKLRMDVRDTAKNLVMTGGIIFSLLVLAIFAGIGKVYMKQSCLDSLTSDVYKIKNQDKEMMAALDKVNTVKRFTNQRDSFLYYYHRLMKVRPRNIVIDRVIFTRKKEFSLLGRGTAMGEIWKFVSTLKDEDVFGKIELRYSRQKKQKDSEFTEFELVCHL